jgi:rubredoxin
MRLRPLQGSTQRGLPTSQLRPIRRSTKAAQSATLMEFLPLRRMSPSESTPRRLATPTTFRPQGFAPSRRLSPRSNVRPCFMPVTSMGFRPSGGFPRCQVPPARRRRDYPLDVSPPHCTVNSAMQGARFSADPVKSLRHEPLSPPGLCSDSESVPPLDCYIRCRRPIPS